MEKIIIGLVGEIASGKGTVAEYLQKKKDANIYKFSSVLRDILVTIHCDITRNNMQKLSTTLRNNFGEDLLAKIISQDTKNDNNRIIVIDGIRRHEDIKYLSQNDNFILVQITANPKIRYNRLIKRNENKGDTTKTYEEFLLDQKKEADQEIPEIMKTAKHELNNNENIDKLYQKINNLISKYEL